MTGDAFPAFLQSAVWKEILSAGRKERVLKICVNFLCSIPFPDSFMSMNVSAHVSKVVPWKGSDEVARIALEIEAQFETYAHFHRTEYGK